MRLEKKMIDNICHFFPCSFCQNASPKALKNLRVQSPDAKISLVASPRIESGTIYPLAIQVYQTLFSACQTSILVQITDDGVPGPSLYNLTLSCVAFGSIFKFTFLDFDQTVQYAMAHPPNATCGDLGCPVLQSLHGAGSKAEWLIPYYKQQNISWVFVPNGRRRFGYDWLAPFWK